MVNPAERVVDKGRDGGKELGMEFVDRCEGIPDPPDGGERFGQIFFYSKDL